MTHELLASPAPEREAATAGSGTAGSGTARPRPAEPDVDVVHESARPLDLHAILGSLRRGAGDPCHRAGPDGSLWRTSLLPAGPVAYRLTALGRHRVRCQAWGSGAAELAAGLADLLGEQDDLGGFEPRHAKVIDAHRRSPGLRIPRTGRVLEALVPAILEQKVTGLEARRAWCQLVARHGTAAPGPVPPGMMVPPSARAWRMVPSWDFHRAGVDPQRARTIVTAARVAHALEACGSLPLPDAHRRLQAVPGIGVWTVAEVAVRALGDPDALSVGDYHLAGRVGWTLAGRPFTDPEMVEYLEPWRPHRGRVIRLLELGGSFGKPRFGPRITIQDHRRH